MRAKLYTTPPNLDESRLDPLAAETFIKWLQPREDFTALREDWVMCDDGDGVPIGKTGRPSRLVAIACVDMSRVQVDLFGRVMRRYWYLVTTDKWSPSSQCIDPQSIEAGKPTRPLRLEAKL
jgi:hypothetical protein